QAMLLLGPPGVGKTSAIGKLAAAGAVAGRKMGIITTDLDRAGAVAQLKTYTSKLKMPLLEVDDPKTIRDAQAVHPEVTQWLIDTTGCNPFNEDEKNTLKTVLKASNATPVLVLPAGLD